MDWISRSQRTRRSKGAGPHPAAAPASEPASGLVRRPSRAPMAAELPARSWRESQPSAHRPRPRRGCSGWGARDLVVRARAGPQQWKGGGLPAGRPRPGAPKHSVREVSLEPALEWAPELCGQSPERLGEALSRGRTRWRLAMASVLTVEQSLWWCKEHWTRSQGGIPLPALGSAITCLQEFPWQWAIVVTDLSTSIDVPA